MDASSVDLIRSLSDFCGGAICSTETGGDELLAILVEQVECGQVGARRDLDELSKSVSDLCLRKCSEEGEVEECLHGSMVSSQTVLVVAVVDGNLDRDRCINQTNDSGRDSDVVGVASVGSTGKSARNRLVCCLHQVTPPRGISGQSALKLSLAVASFTQQHQ